MIKWFAYIVLLLIFAPRIAANAYTKNNTLFNVAINKTAVVPLYNGSPVDTVSKSKKQQENTKIKEIAKAKRQAKPEQVDDAAHIPKPKPKRQRRPEGLERPPEIPRRNGN